MLRIWTRKISLERVTPSEQINRDQSVCRCPPNRSCGVQFESKISLFLFILVFILIYMAKFIGTNTKLQLKLNCVT